MKKPLFKNKSKKFKEKLIKILTNKKLICFVSLLVFIYIVFNVFKQFSVVISYDSTNYYSYLEIFNGKRGLKTWNIERGFSFPLIIFIITKIFGNTGSGYLNGIFILYISMLLISLYFITYLIKYNKIEKKKSMYYLLFVFLMLLNPIIFGWSHYMLTEAIAPPIYFFCLLCCFKLFDYDLKKDKTKIILSIIFLSLMSILLWFLKQPYAPFLWMMLIMNAVLIGISQRNFKLFLKYIGVFLIVILSTLLSIKIWNTCLYKSNPEILDGRTSSFYFQRNLFEGIYYHVKPLEKKEYCSIEFVDEMKLNKRRKKNIYSLIKYNENWCNHLVVYEVTDLNNKLYKHEYLVIDGEFPSTSQSLLFIAKLWARYPIIQMDTVVKGYLSITDLHNTSYNYKATGVFNGNADKEMKNSFYSLSYNQPNTWWQANKDNPEYERYFTDSMKGYIDTLKGYESITTKSSFWSNFMMIFEESSMLYFKLILLFCLPIGIYSFIRFIKYSKSKAYYLITLISFSSFAHIMFHVLMGAIIDRYAYPVYPLMLLTLIIMFMQNNDDKEFINVSEGDKKNGEKNKTNKSRKKR